MTLPQDLPNVVLVGTGVVGRAILAAHIAANVSVCVTDQNTESLQQAIEELKLDPNQWQTQSTVIGAAAAAILRHSSDQISTTVPIVIESIAERLDAKRAFFQQAEQTYGPRSILCSNTSTLKVSSISDGLDHPQRVCGMHFFMPVNRRDAVEVVATQQSDQATIAACQQHVQRIHKSPLLVSDSPGFIVNRMLSPYLNQSLLLLAHGISADRIERAARAYGMPMSPLELIDWIGTRTMFDAGRAFWQAFPTRLDASPIVPALIKQKRLGHSVSAGMYDYVDGQRSEQLSPVTQEIAAKYSLGQLVLTDQEITALLAIPMFIEASLALQTKVASSVAQIELAMTGGLGFEHEGGWSGFFDSVGSQSIIDHSVKWSKEFKSIASPATLLNSLRVSPPQAALTHIASSE